ncbi:hypothetical protein IAT38_001593 [Cryptococcus sp. DSM 104549]
MTSTPQPQGSPSTTLSPPRPSSAPPDQVPTSTPSGTSTPALAPSRAIPTDFRSSLAAWWSTSSYKDARMAEERLLKRLSVYEPAPPPAEVANKGWFGLGGSSAANSGLAADPPHADTQAQVTIAPASATSGSLVATLRNVFIPTPNPADAPAHPADPREPTSAAGVAGATDSPASSVSDLTREKKHYYKLGHGHKCKKDKEDKLVDYINTLEISRPEFQDRKEAVVVLHGYAAALGFFFRNWESIATSSASTSRRTFFLDWLGMGLSSRPSHSLLNSPSDTPTPSRVARAEHFFVSSLENWRRTMGLEKMLLVGHSLGGYLASAYAVRYPERVSGLILVSPAGIPHGPEYVRYPLTAELPAGHKAVPGKNAREEVETPGELDDAVDAAEAEMQGGGKTGKIEAKGEAKQWQERREQSVVRRGLMKFFVWGWERGLSPFSILRGVGPFGPLWVGKYSSRRFASQTEEDVRDLHAYIYGTSIMRGSGEYCISHILAPGAYARIPILDRIARVKVPVTFLYGDNDWMDVQGGRDALTLLKNAGNTLSSVHVVPNAGHHLYLDNPEVSNQLLDDAIKAIPAIPAIPAL